MKSNRWAGEYNNSGTIVYFYGNYKNVTDLRRKLKITVNDSDLNVAMRWRLFKIPKYAYHGIDQYPNGVAQNAAK